MLKEAGGSFQPQGKAWLSKAMLPRLFRIFEAVFEANHDTETKASLKRTWLIFQQTFASTATFKALVGLRGAIDYPIAVGVVGALFHTCNFT